MKYMYYGVCAILRQDELHIGQLSPIDDRLEGFVTMAFSKVDAVKRIRNAFNADKLETEDSRLGVLILGEEVGDLILCEPFIQQFQEHQEKALERTKNIA